MVIGPDKALSFAERIAKKWNVWGWRLQAAAIAIALLTLAAAISGVKILVDKAWRDEKVEPTPTASSPLATASSQPQLMPPTPAANAAPTVPMSETPTQPLVGAINGPINGLQIGSGNTQVNNFGPKRRTLEPHQAAELDKHLASFGHQTIAMVSSPINDDEAAAYAAKLVTAIQAAGWLITVPAGTWMPSGADRPTGLWIGVGNLKAPPPGAVGLYKSMTQANFRDVHLYETRMAGESECSLFVGHAE